MKNKVPNSVTSDDREGNVGSGDDSTESTALESLSDKGGFGLARWPPPDDDFLREEVVGDGEFQIGDHVYIWCSYLGIPRAYQHHGIVVDASEEHVTIVDFYAMINDGEEHEAKHGSFGKGPRSLRGKSFSRGSSGEFNGRRGVMSEYNVYESKLRTKWKKVQYGAAWSERLFCRAGTCSPVEPDIAGLVLARADFLLENQHLIPPYHVATSNCECVAVWCKTGQFCSLQGSAALRHSAISTAGSATVMGASAAAATTTVPAAGLWGWMGFTTTVPLTAAMPWLMPAIAAYGVSSTAAPFVVLQFCKKEWNETTQTLNLVLTDYNLRGMFLAHYPTYDL